MTPVGPRDISVPEIMTAAPPCVSVMPAYEKMAGCWGEGVAVVVTGVYVVPAIMMGLESACVGWRLVSSGALLSLAAILLGWS